MEASSGQVHRHFPIVYNRISVTATVCHYAAVQQIDKAANQSLNAAS